MLQKKRHSLCEAVISTTIGYFVALASQLVIFPLFNIHVPLHDNIMIGVYFTAISIVRSYAIRRFMTRRV